MVPPIRKAAVATLTAKGANTPRARTKFAIMILLVSGFRLRPSA
jgi:hypothetical protein